VFTSSGDTGRRNDTGKGSDMETYNVYTIERFDGTLFSVWIHSESDNGIEECLVPGHWADYTFSGTVNIDFGSMGHVPDVLTGD